MRITPLLRSIALVLAAIIPFVSSLSATRAQARPVERARFIGQVLAIAGPADRPIGFTLRLINQPVDLVITPRTTFVARSAEANVEGLGADDYAAVNARRSGREWVAIRVDYDLQPVPPLRSLTGMILRVSPDARRFLVKLDVGGSRWIAIGRQTHFLLDGRPLDVPPEIFKGETAQIVVQRVGNAWVALNVDLRSSL